MKIKEEIKEFTREAFAQMQNKEDLLQLINGFANLFNNRLYEPVDIDIMSDALNFTPEEYNLLKNRKAITLKQLDFFSTSFDFKDKKRNRYTRFHIRKKSGNLREIKAPLPKLKEIQRAINTILHTVYTMQEQAYGFVPGKSIANNARLHAGASFILNVDIKDFFPSVHFRRVKLMLEKEPFNLTGEREPLAFLIANLCTEDGVLPQGAPTSPILTNIICQRLDRRLQQLATQYKAIYSRYADDITFSADEYIFTRRFMQRLEKILKDDRFEINPEKTRIQGKAYRQEVTGLTVNEKVNVSRQFYRSYCTLLHLYKTKGAETALNYHRRRMPDSVIQAKMKKEIKNPETYMQNVIWGKYYFISMVKGKDSIPPPFERPIDKIRLGDGTYLSKTIKLYPSHKEEDTINQNTVLSDKSVIYEVSEKKTISGTSLVEKILEVWEMEREENGFEKAMALLKKQLNEQ